MSKHIMAVTFTREDEAAQKAKGPLKPIKLNAYVDPPQDMGNKKWEIITKTSRHQSSNQTHDY